MSWVCDIPGASAALSVLHLTLHVGLAAAVVLGGATFLALGLRSYRTPPDGRRQSDSAPGVPGVPGIPGIPGVAGLQA